MDIIVHPMMDRYDARRSDDYHAIDWPPSPDRMFQAMVASAYSFRDQAERDAALRWLRWLEQQPAPTIYAPITSMKVPDILRYMPRSCVTTLKNKNKNKNDENDKSGINAINILSDVVSANDIVMDQQPIVFRYDIEDSSLQDADRLIARKIVKNVPYFGTSSTPIRAEIRYDRSLDTKSLVRYNETASGRHRVRVPYPGRLDALDFRHDQLVSMFNNNMAQKSESKHSRLIATSGYQHYVRYAQSNEPEMTYRGAFDTMAILQISPDSPFIDGSVFARCTESARAAFLRVMHGPRHGAISGHNPDGSPYQGPHAAFLPLIRIGHPNISGQVDGLAITLPYAAPPDLDQDTWNAMRQEAMDAFLSISSIDVRGRVLVTRPVQGYSKKWSTSAKRYEPSYGSTKWTTITPIVLFKFPKKHRSINDLLLEAIDRAGYPRPIDIVHSPYATIFGACDIHIVRRNSDVNGCLVHATLEFDKRIRGPMLIGRERYKGFGLLLPQR